MHEALSRRDFLGAIAATAAFQSLGCAPALHSAARQAPALPFRISLAEWSLHRTIRSKALDHLDFAKYTREEFGLEAVEYVNGFFKDKAQDAAYLRDMNARADDHGIVQHLIMIDAEGRLGDPDAAKRTQAVENHYKWVDAA